MTEIDMWGDFKSEEDIKWPKTYLKEQASLLAQKTKFVLLGEVSLEVSASGSTFLELDIRARMLNDYRRTILRVTHGIDPYPLSLEDLEAHTAYECKTEESFRERLEATLSSPAVRKVVGRLLSQSKAYARLAVAARWWRAVSA